MEEENREQVDNELPHLQLENGGLNGKGKR